MDSGGSSNVTQTQEFKPPDYTVQGWKDLVNNVSQYTQLPNQIWQGPRVAAPNEQQLTANQFIMDRGLNGSPDLNSARGMLAGTVNGNYLGNNPWASDPIWDKVISNNTENMASAHAMGTAAQNDSAYAMQGAYGGSAWDQKQRADAMAMVKAAGQQADATRLEQTKLGAQMYGDERNRMLSAANSISTLSQDDWTAARMMAGAGDFLQNQVQQGYDANYQAWQDQINAPLKNFDLMMNALRGASGSGGSSFVSSNNGSLNIPANVAGILGTGWAMSNFLGGGGK